MIVRQTVRLTEILRRTRAQIIFATGYSVLIVALHKWDIAPVTIPMAIPAMLGTALSILLGFRTNSAYDRWWEARKIWGAIVNDSRSFARQIMSLFVLPEGGNEQDMSAMQREMVHRQIAWNYVLARSLRGQDPFPDVQTTLTASEISELQPADNRANAILQTQAHRLSDALRRGYLDTLRFLPIEATLSRLCDHMGMCERIKSTIFPVHYAYLVSRIIWVFFLLLPSGLVESLGWVTVPVASAISLIFWFIEAKGASLQNPFEDAVTDTPMLALSRTIEINLRQQLGETDLPKKLNPIDGVLM